MLPGTMYTLGRASCAPDRTSCYRPSGCLCRRKGWRSAPVRSLRQARSRVGSLPPEAARAASCHALDVATQLDLFGEEPIAGVTILRAFVREMGRVGRGKL